MSNTGFELYLTALTLISDGKEERRRYNRYERSYFRRVERDFKRRGERHVAVCQTADSVVSVMTMTMMMVHVSTRAPCSLLPKEGECVLKRGEGLCASFLLFLGQVRLDSKSITVVGEVTDIIRGIWYRRHRSARVDFGRSRRKRRQRRK